MKQLKLACLYLVFMILAGVKVYAYNYKADGICYILNNNNQTAAVTYSGYPYNNDYTGRYQSDLSLKDKDIVIPSTIIQNDVEYTVTAIGDKAFYDCESNVLMSSVTIPSTITSIGELAFTQCTNLTSFTIPASILSIGSQAFSGCPNLVSVTIHRNTPVSIDAYTFSNRANATLYVPFGSKAAYEAADYWKEFKEIVEMEPEYAIGDVFIAKTVEGVDMTFTVTNLEPMEVQVGGIDVGNAINTSTMGQVTIPSEVNGFAVTGICQLAFKDCSGITGIVIPESVTDLGYNTFAGCTGLTSVVIPCGVTVISSSTFKNCSGLTSLTLNDALTTIGQEAFWGCTKLTSLVVPDNVTYISQSAFYACSGLTTITLGKKLDSIGSTAFGQCTQITDVYCLAESQIPSASINEFGDSYYNYPTLHVPASLLHDYREMSVDIWCHNFKTIVAIAEPVETTDISTFTNAVYANESLGLKGGTATLTISMKNAQATSAYSFDLVLPDGVTVDSYTLSSRHNGHAETMNRNETTGVYSFAVLSLQSKEIKDNDGVIWMLKLNVADNVEAGDYAVKIQNAKYSLTSGSTSVVLPEVTSLLTIEDYIKGDANGDSTVDIADAVCIVNHVVGKEAPTFVEVSSDANGDGVVDIADAVRIVNLVVGKINALAPKMEMELKDPE